MNTHLIEEEIAYLLVVHAAEHMENTVENPEDLDAAICAVLARALEIASNRKLKPIYEIFETTKPVWLQATFYLVRQKGEDSHESAGFEQIYWVSLHPHFCKGKPQWSI